ncbi:MULTISPECIES: flagellar protein FlaG [Bacillaceae]|uniref:flagellar protein FlaG n=1 Tax=Bacillaceae TaxID=186817 RepID=UPI002FFE815B
MIDKLSNLNTQATDFQVKQVDPVEQTEKTKEVSLDQPQDQSKQNQQLTKEKTEKVINSLNDFLKASTTHLKFQYHEELQKYYVAIVDDQTNEVVKEIPPKKLLDMYAAMEDYLGLLVDKKA